MGANAAVLGLDATARGVEVDELTNRVGDDEGGTVGGDCEYRAGYGRVLSAYAVCRGSEGHQLEGASHVNGAAVITDDHRVGLIRQTNRTAELRLCEIYRHKIERVGACNVEIGAVGAWRCDENRIRGDCFSVAEETNLVEWGRIASGRLADGSDGSCAGEDGSYRGCRSSRDS